MIHIMNQKFQYNKNEKSKIIIKMRFDNFQNQTNYLFFKNNEIIHK